MGAPGGWDVEVIADSDSRWKWGASLAQRLRADGAVRVHGSLLRGRATPTDRQLADVGAHTDSMRTAPMDDVLSTLATTQSSVVVLACVGGTIQALLHGLSRVWRERTDRPVVITGYVGLVYERVVDGLLLRAGADLVLANSAFDARRFAEVFSSIGMDAHCVVRTALPFLDSGTAYDPQARTDRPFTMTFAAQPSVPTTRAERRYVADHLAQHARRHPDQHVVVKLRGRPGERTTHSEPFHYQSLLPRPMPPNLEIAYGSMAAVLDRTDVLVTVSSTAALEAMHRRIPTAMLLDFGVREALGNHMFVGSGAFSSFAQLDDGALPVVSDRWAADNGIRDTDPYAEVRTSLAALVGARSELAPLRPWLSLRDCAFYLPAVLARNGLGVDGASVGAPGRVGQLRNSVLRRAVRTLEPHARRWAQG